MKLIIATLFLISAFTVSAEDCGRSCGDLRSLYQKAERNFEESRLPTSQELTSGRGWKSTGGISNEGYDVFSRISTKTLTRGLNFNLTGKSEFLSTERGLQVTMSDWSHFPTRALIDELSQSVCWNLENGVIVAMCRIQTSGKLLCRFTYDEGDDVLRTSFYEFEK